MFRNYEGYADPTAGSAIALVTRDERRRRRTATRNQSGKVTARTRRKHNRGKESKGHRNAQVKWVKAWSAGCTAAPAHGKEVSEWTSSMQ